jgi:hypothetical protein
MTVSVADRVLETTNTTGTGTLTLAGAVSGYQAFSAAFTSATTIVFYSIVSGSSWENGIGTYTLSGTTLARTTILSSSNSGSAITVAAGASVFCTYPAEKAIYSDQTGLIQNSFSGMTNGSGLVPTAFEYRLNSTLAGTNASGAQSALGVGITVAGSTVYEFEGLYVMSKSAGTTSYTLSTLFGGTATINNIGYTVLRYFDTAGFNTVNLTPAAYAYISVATAATTMTGSTSATSYHIYQLKGTVSINAAGTFIPQYSLSAAPGGAFTMQIGSYFKMTPLGASGANTNIGGWA